MGIMLIPEEEHSPLKCTRYRLLESSTIIYFEKGMNSIFGCMVMKRFYGSSGAKTTLQNGKSETKLSKAVDGNNLYAEVWSIFKNFLFQFYLVDWLYVLL